MGHDSGEVGDTAQTSLALFIISTVPIAGGSGRHEVCARRGRGRERGSVFLLPFLLRATFEVARLSRPVTVRYSRGCELSSRLGWLGSAGMGMLSFTNKHSLNPAEIGRNRGTKRSRAHFVKERREHHARGLYRPDTNMPDLVLNEFELLFSRPEKESSIFRPRRIQGGNRPLATVSLRQHS